MFLQFFDFLHEIREFLKTPIHTRVTDVSHLIETFETLHHPFSNGHGWNFPVKLLCQLILDLIRQFFDGLVADGALLTGALQSGNKLLTGKFLGATIPLNNRQTVVFDLLVSRKAVAAGEAFASSADRETLA